MEKHETSPAQPAGVSRRRGRTRATVGVENPVLPVQAVQEPVCDLLTGDITADLSTTGAPLPASVRDDNGRFVRGAPSPNPCGRPAVAPEVRDAARAYTAEMLSVLVNVAMDGGAAPAARVAAATAVLDRGHGKPVASIEAKVAVADVSAMHLATLEELARGPMAAAPVAFTDCS